MNFKNSYFKFHIKNLIVCMINHKFPSSTISLSSITKVNIQCVHNMIVNGVGILLPVIINGNMRTAFDI